MVAISGPPLLADEGNFGLLHQNLYACNIINTVFRKVYVFVRKRVEPTRHLSAFFTPSKNKTLL
jgi:hypothetical protein